MSSFDQGWIRLKGFAALTLIATFGTANLPGAFPPIPSGSWQGPGTDDNEPFGGSPYCDYTVTMQNVVLSFYVSPPGTIASASASATMIESAVGCPFPTIPTNNHTFTGTGSISGNTITLQLAGASTNNPKDIGAFTGTLNGSGQIQGTLTFTRTDIQAPLNWTTHHSVTAATGGAGPLPPFTDDNTGSTTLGLSNDATTGPSACTSGDPVNCATGNLIETSVDLRVAQGRGRALRLVRTYDSQDAATALAPGPLGYGWTHSYASYLSIYPGGNVMVHQWNGSTVPFTLSGSSFTPPAFVIATLTKNSDGTYTFTLPNQAADIFSAAGRLQTQTDRNGYQTNLAYDSSGHLTTVTDPSGRTYTFQYGANNLVSSVTDPIGRTVSYAYDPNLNLTAFTDIGDFVTNYTYDTSHQLTQITDPNGGKTSNAYDSNNRVVVQFDPAGRMMTFVYSAPTTTITDGDGNVTVQTYTNNQLTSITRGSGTSSAATTTFTYDAAGNRVSSTDANGHTTTATYDARGNQLTRTDALGRKSVFTYDAQNNLLTATDPLNITTTYTYDAHGNLASISRPLTGSQAATTTFQYGDSSHPGDLTAVTDATGRTWTASYDANGALIRGADPAGDLSTISVNGIGWVIGGVTPRGNAPGANAANYTVALAYSPRGDLLQTTDQLGHTTTLTYDANRNPLTYTDANGKITHYAYDADNERVKVTRADGSVWTTAFDAAANVTGQTDGLGRTTSYAYDALNRRTQTTDPLGRSVHYQFDGAGNLTGFVNASGQATTFTYDAANQRTGIAYSDGVTPAVAFAYDGDGRRTSMTDGTGVSTYQYDSLNRMTASSDGAASQVHYAYDLAGRIVSLTYPSGSQVTRAFDAAGRLASVTDWLGNTNNFSYDADGNLVKAGYGNGAASERTYDPDDRVASVAYALGGHFLDLGFSYTRDNIGQITSVATIPGATEAYTYSPVNQLSAVNNLTFAVDAGDNLTQFANTPLTYDAANELTSGGGATFTYNARGDRTQSMSAAGTASYNYDQTDRLTAVGTSATYAYNGDGLRMRKTVAGAATAFAWELLGAAPLLLAAGQTQFIYGLGGRPLEQVNPDGSVLWIHQDHQGSTRILTNSEGRIAARYSYGAYGQRSNADGGDDGSVAQTPLLFAGQFTDSESGFEYLRARYYDQTTGQFLTRDPMAGVTRHPYLYANGNPVNGADPTGLDDDAPIPSTVELPTVDDSSSSSTTDTSGGFEGPAPAPTPVVLPSDALAGFPTGPVGTDACDPGIGGPTPGTGGNMVAGGTIGGGSGGGTVPPPNTPYQPGNQPPNGGPLPEETPAQAARKIANRALGWLENAADVVGKVVNSVLPVIYFPQNVPGS